MPARPKLIGDKDRLIPPALRAQVLAHLKAERPSWPAHPCVALLVVRLALQAGLRVSEVAHLRVKDLDLVRAPYRLYVVGGKMRAKDHVAEVPIPPDLAQLLTTHVQGASLDAYVMGLRPEPFHRAYLYQLVKAAHRACGVPEVYNVHSWRHAYGTEVYRKTKDLVLTKMLMRHRETTTTERYVHMAELDARIAPVMQALELPEEPVPVKSAKVEKKSKTRPTTKAGRH